jgi:phenylalanine-4-hydroxylase
MNIKQKYCQQYFLILKIKGAELESDHPGFNDIEYRNRRNKICEISKQTKIGDKIARIEYSKQEIECWSTVYKKLHSIHKIHACKEYNTIFPLLEENCGLSENNIPQLEDLSNFLKGL